MLDARRDAFVFLGHTHRWRLAAVVLSTSVQRRCQRIRDELRRKTRHTWVSLAAMVAELNPYIRGARHYFRRVRRRTLSNSILRQAARRALVGAQASRPPAGMVARVPGCAPAPPRAGAMEPPGGASSSRRKVCTVNVEGSRMREIRTYGLMRGCWPVRLRTAGWGLLDRIDRVLPGWRPNMPTDSCSKCSLPPA